MKISDGVESKAVVGGFPCPEPRSTASFPEPYTSNTDMNSKISISRKRDRSTKPQYDKHILY